MTSGMWQESLSSRLQRVCAKYVADHKLDSVAWQRFEFVALQNISLDKPSKDLDSILLRMILEAHASFETAAPGLVQKILEVLLKEEKTLSPANQFLLAVYANLGEWVTKNLDVEFRTPFLRNTIEIIHDVFLEPFFNPPKHVKPTASFKFEDKEEFNKKLTKVAEGISTRSKSLGSKKDTIATQFIVFLAELLPTIIPKEQRKEDRGSRPEKKGS